MSRETLPPQDKLGMPHNQNYKGKVGAENAPEAFCWAF